MCQKALHYVFSGLTNTCYEILHLWRGTEENKSTPTEMGAKGTETDRGGNVHSSQISKTHATFNIIKLGDGVKLGRKRQINRKEDGAARGVGLTPLTDITRTMKSDLFYSTSLVKSGLLQLPLVDMYVSCLTEKQRNVSSNVHLHAARRSIIST